MPVTPGDRRSVERVARPAVRRPVLPVTKHVVRDRVVDGHVVHLRDRRLDAVIGLATIARDVHALVVPDDQAVGVVGIDPQVVVVTTGALVPLVVDVGESPVVRA